MKKIFLVIVLAVLATTAAEAQLQNTVFKAKVFISDKQTSIGEHDTFVFQRLTQFDSRLVGAHRIP